MGRHSKPAGQADRAATANTIKGLRAMRSGLTLAGLDWKALRDEGR